MIRAAAVVSFALVASASPAAGPPPEPAPAADPRVVIGAPRGPARAGPALEAATQEIASMLRCPVCQGLSVADSPTDLARNMKSQVRDLLAAGYDREQVLQYFEASYGEFVRLQPPLRGVNWLVWVAPVAGLLGGGFVVARALRRAPAAPLAHPGTEAPDDALGPYLLRVRELAYGWPGGRPPQPPGAGEP